MRVIYRTTFPNAGSASMNVAATYAKLQAESAGRLELHVRRISSSDGLERPGRWEAADAASERVGHFSRARSTSAAMKPNAGQYGPLVARSKISRALFSCPFSKYQFPTP